MGRNCAYKPIVIKSTDCLMDKTVRVKVVEASATYLKGAIAEL